MRKKSFAIQHQCEEYGSSKDTYVNTSIKDANHIFIINLSFRKMSDNEVEEAGIDAYMVYHQRMLDGLDNPSEVNGVGDGTCAGDNYVERESNAMGRDGGANGG